jgi:peroxiredoxin
MKKAILLPALLALLLGAASCTPKGPSKPGGLGVGDDAYPFTLIDGTGAKRSLKDVKPGWPLLLIFYRGHWCDACRNQLLDLKAGYDVFTRLKVAIACVSSEDPETTAEFAKTWKFPFPLLADPGFEAIDAYGLRHPKGNEGKDISKPGVIIISPQKKVVYKRVGASPVDLPANEELFEWFQQHPFPEKP